MNRDQVPPGVPNLSSVQGLPYLLADPARLHDVPAEKIPALLGELEQVRAMLWSRLTAPAAALRQESELVDDDDQLLDDQAAGRMLGVAAGCIADLRKRGEVPEVRVGGKYVRVRRGDLRAYVHRQREDHLVRRSARRV